ncbi:hypothetical protein COMA2_170030 [Candidatus Nitrospira nitrificans]|uniref:Uncharacterized protein n=1 Tax=Candidatus Nitrospira nitrificans TaxID=1742973 RepID=A0A0S4LEW9_9BACT|nr:hypothetical protein COMA2_170030 [Candidatus Nitrospira nitrificans]
MRIMGTAGLFPLVALVVSILKGGLRSNRVDRNQAFVGFKIGGRTHNLSFPLRLSRQSHAPKHKLVRKTGDDLAMRRKIQCHQTPAVA